MEWPAGRVHKPVVGINVPWRMQPDRFCTMAHMVIGYARVSTDGQDESLQIDALDDLRDGDDVLVV